MTPLRAGAILLMLLCAAGAYGVVGTAAFAFRHLTVDGEHYTPDDAVTAALALQQGTNLVRLRTDTPRRRPADHPDRARRAGLDRAARHGPRPHRRARADPRLGRRGAPLPRRPVRPPVRHGRRRGGRGDRRPAGHPRHADVGGRAVRRRRSSTRSTSTSRPASGSLKPADLASAAAELTVTVDDTGGFVMTQRHGRLARDVRDLHARPSARRPWCPSRCACCGASSSSAGRPTWPGSTSPDDATGTYELKNGR